MWTQIYTDKHGSKNRESYGLRPMKPICYFSEADNVNAYFRVHPCSSLSKDGLVSLASISVNRQIKMDLQSYFYAEHTLSIQHADSFHDTALVDGPYLVRLLNGCQ